MKLTCPPVPLFPHLFVACDLFRSQCHGRLSYAKYTDVLRQLKAALDAGSGGQGGYGSERHLLREMCLAPLQAISTATATGRNAGGCEGSAQEKKLALQCMCLLLADADADGGACADDGAAADAAGHNAAEMPASLISTGSGRHGTEVNS